MSENGIILKYDESQGSIATNLRCDELLYYTFINYSAGERIFKIDEHLAKLQASLTVSYTPFTLHFCPDRLTPSVTDRLLIMYGILSRQLFFVVAVVCSGSWDFYMADVNNFLLVN